MYNMDKEKVSQMIQNVFLLLFSVFLFESVCDTLIKGVAPWAGIATKLCILDHEGIKRSILLVFLVQNVGESQMTDSTIR